MDLTVYGFYGTAQLSCGRELARIHSNTHWRLALYISRCQQTESMSFIGIGVNYSCLLLGDYNSLDEKIDNLRVSRQFVFDRAKL